MNIRNEMIIFQSNQKFKKINDTKFQNSRKKIEKLDNKKNQKIKYPINS